MTSGAHRRRLVARPPTPRCVQCGKEDQILGRADKLGQKCAIYKDQSLAKVARTGVKRKGDD